MEQNTPDLHLNPQRSQTLTVLCVLSFIASAIMIVVFAMGINKAILSPEEAAQQQQMVNMMKIFNPEAARSIENGLLMNVFQLVAQLLSLVGVVMMFKMKKTGLYIYAAFELIPYLFILFLTGTEGLKLLISLGLESGMEDRGLLNNIFYIVTLCFVLTDVLFIFLYSTNLKNPKKP